MIVNSSTSPHALEVLFDQTGMLDAEIAPQISSAELATLVRAHKGYRHWNPLLQLIAIHPSADGALLSLIVRASNDPGVLNAVATSGRTSKKLLEQLSRSTYRSVREHAKMGLLYKELEMATAERFREILNENRGDDERAVSVRGLLAMHQRTPRDVLHLLAQDEFDFVRRAVSMRSKRPSKNQ
ncbi:hypothetical protein [Cystobacter fuscus]|uniref:hypothetical protein n=1 Tax=Cystobacter fuscus TaxID=43 RepID=UPI0012FD73AD|nr:hypothetical protein [Cystobacter fuscus]